MSFLDRTIGIFSPVAEARRIRAKMLVGQLRAMADKTRMYEGASHGRRTKNWRAQPTSAVTETRMSLSVLRDRCRDLVRNNPWAERGVRANVSNTVGAGIVAQFSASSDRASRTIQMAWRDWAESRTCDADGKHDFYGLQALAMRTVIESGEVLIRRVVRRNSAGNLPLQIQLLEPDYLDTTKDSMMNGENRIIQGIELSPLNEIVAYWLFPEHPGSYVVSAKGFVSQRVPAADILHMFRIDRPGQIRGVPWLSPAILRLRDLDEFEDALLVRQKIAACFVAYIRDIEAGGTGDLVKDAKEKRELEKFEPGMVEMLPPGKDITFANPPPSDGASDHVRSVLRSIAAALGQTYEALTGDLTQVNYSSARIGRLEYLANINQWQWFLLIPFMCDPVASWFLEAFDLTSGLPNGVTRNWTTPRREMIDPVKETDAIKSQLRNGLISWREAIRQTGQDPDAVREEIAKSNADLDAAGIILDCDPRRRSNIGSDPGGSSASTNATGTNEAQNPP